MNLKQYISGNWLVYNISHLENKKTQCIFHIDDFMQIEHSGLGNKHLKGHASKIAVYKIPWVS